MTGPEPRGRRLSRAGDAAEDEPAAASCDTARVEHERSPNRRVVLEEQLLERVRKREAGTAAQRRRRKEERPSAALRVHEDAARGRSRARRGRNV